MTICCNDEPEQVPIGNGRWIKVTITDPDTGAPMDPDVVLAFSQANPPSGTVSSLTVQKISAGIYRAQVLIAQLGLTVAWFENNTTFNFDTASQASFIGIPTGHS